MTYLHPFSEPKLIAGHGTIALEILEDIPDLAVLVIPGGGVGSIMGGSALALKQTSPSVRVVGVEVGHVARLHHSFKQGRLADFPPDGGYVGPPRVSRLVFDLVRQYVDDLVVVTDAERQETLRGLWGELEVAAGSIGATALTAVLWGRLGVPAKGSVCAIVGSSGEGGLF